LLFGIRIIRLKYWVTHLNVLNKKNGTVRIQSQTLYMQMKMRKIYCCGAGAGCGCCGWAGAGAGSVDVGLVVWVDAE
jgi:hypothetical protein